MASCNEIAVKEKTSTKVLLKGKITGLDSGKRYCLHYYSWGWKNMPNSTRNYTYMSGRTSFDLGSVGCYVPAGDLIEGKQFEVACHEVENTCESRITAACQKILYNKAPVPERVFCKNYFYARDRERNNLPFTVLFEIFERRASGWVKVGEGNVVSGQERFLYVYSDITQKFVPKDVPGWTKPADITITGCYKHVYFTYTKEAEEPPVPPVPPEPKPECTTGDKKPGKVCVNGYWEDALCTEGAYTADRKKVCRGGAWVDVEGGNGVPEPPYPEPPYPGDGKYLTVEEANERIRKGLPCYIKCILPILDLLPGITYTPGAWVPPLCAITAEP